MLLKKLIWKESYSSGIDLLDRQHKAIFREFNEFYEKINDRDFDRSDIDKFLKELNSYTTTHFETEENFMVKENFPHYKEHKKRHKFFKAVYDEIKENKFFRESAEHLFSIHLAATAAEWLESHVVTYDRELADFLKEKGY